MRIIMSHIFREFKAGVKIYETNMKWRAKLIHNFVPALNPGIFNLYSSITVLFPS